MSDLWKHTSGCPVRMLGGRGRCGCGVEARKRREQERHDDRLVRCQEFIEALGSDPEHAARILAELLEQ